MQFDIIILVLSVIALLALVWSLINAKKTTTNNNREYKLITSATIVILVVIIILKVFMNGH